MLECSSGSPENRQAEASATKQRTLENNRKELVRNTLYLTPRNTSLPPPQKHKCVNSVVNNTDSLQIDVLVFAASPSLRRLFVVAAERRIKVMRRASAQT